MGGTGKTASILAMVEKSCFGNGKPNATEDVHAVDGQSSLSVSSVVNLSCLCGHIVAYHFCQADNAPPVLSQSLSTLSLPKCHKLLSYLPTSSCYNLTRPSKPDFLLPVAMPVLASPW